ncbi:VanZ family protein [Bifidobacterium crudilactis]|jgi:glycopeptide antibiotics resistance protein|uniref:VanZ family protein n=1 Tax=Bifidobacterium crudilactis TaxID=327277 RepID=UPI0023546307|nr:VanZ family protein [Bifidobacterium crudilactis]MCI1218578.1 VanZ family protein [Bifidobacterium crudilactis]
MLGFLGYFSVSFITAVAIWPVVSLILTIPILAVIYHRYHALHFTAAFSAYLVVLYLLALVCFTLWPMPDNPAAFCASHHLHAQLNPFEFLTDVSQGGLYAILQIVMNVLFFVPLGFIMSRVFRWRFTVALPMCFATSLMIETAQLTGAFGFYPCSYRLFDVDDLLWNTVGGVMGFLIALAFAKWIPVRTKAADDVVTRPGFIHRVVSLAIDLTCIYGLAGTLGLGFVVLVVKAGTYNMNGTYGFAGMTITSAGMRIVVLALMAMSFLIFELMLPVLARGQTLGGRFTHMTVEGTERRGWRRTAFYAGRTVVLTAVLGPWGIPALSLTVVLILLIFWLVKRQMPYDLI